MSEKIKEENKHIETQKDLEFVDALQQTNALQQAVQNTTKTENSKNKILPEMQNLSNENEKKSEQPPQDNAVGLDAPSTQDADLNEVPLSVLMRIMLGDTPQQAFADYKQTQLSERIEQLQLQLAAEKQNSFNKQTAISSAESEAAQAGTDDFLCGLYGVLK